MTAAPVCAQVKYNLIDRAAEAELAPACQQFGLSIVPFGPLHGGLLAGMQVKEREFSADKRFGGSGFTGTELEIRQAVERLSQEWGLQPHQVSLAWLLSRPASPRRSSAPRRQRRSPPTPRRLTSAWTRPSSTP
jgi:1-deoxyxylulose-5-phosphate synthase